MGLTGRAAAKFAERCRVTALALSDALALYPETAAAAQPHAHLFLSARPAHSSLQLRRLARKVESRGLRDSPLASVPIITVLPSANPVPW